MITLDKITKSFGSRTLFEGVTITFNEGNRYGLTGPNGAGKSTLLKIMMGVEEATSGNVTLPDRVGILQQNIEDYLQFTVRDVVIMGNKRLWDTMQERDALYEGEMTDEVGLRLGDLEGIIMEEDGYSADSNAEVFLAGAGLSEAEYDLPMHAVPVDIQFRVLLCQALFGEPQALLLDEPTNHLDMESISWLETFLHQYTGTLIVVSHDRHFLNAVTTHIADIDYDTIIIYPGNYDSMVLTKTASRDREELSSKSKEKKVAKLRDFVSRFGAGSRASQVQSRMREIQRLQPQDLKQSNIQRPYIRFIPSEKVPGKLIVGTEKLCKSFDGKPVIKDFTFELIRGDKIGIIGNNGRGKTTLLKMIAQQLTPDSGKLERGHQVLMNYFPQNHSEVTSGEDPTQSIFEYLKKQQHGKYDQDVRSSLGKMLFGGDDAFKPLGNLSGGETARVILAKILLSEHNTIVLDEPNNHLDLEAVSALAWGLEEYKGTVVVVSHDRDLMSTVANKIIAFEEDGIHFFDGKLDDYLAKRKLE
jgi:ATPase subunit of ABC transporter with duplicated ATPase domains